MYHHHVMQSRQHHSTDMHDFLSGDPMSGSLQNALAVAATVSDPSHHGSSGSVAGPGQLHAPSALYGNHPHHHNTVNSINGINGKLYDVNKKDILSSKEMFSLFH